MSFKLTDLSSVAFEGNEIIDKSSASITDLSEIEEQIQSQDIKVLKLRNNNISILRPEFFLKNSSIKYIDISENELSSLSGIESLNDLVLLDVSKNILTTVENIESNQSLKRLLLSGNEITTISMKKPHENLRVLDIHNNDITSISFGKYFPALQELYADKCQLTTLGGLDTFPSLKHFTCANNTIKQTKAIFHDKMQDIDLTNNLIKSFKILSKMQYLVSINLSGNPIGDSSFKGMKEMANVRVIKCSKTQLTKTENIIKFFPNVEYLDLSSTKIEDENEIIKCARDLKRLRYLNTLNTPVTSKYMTQEDSNKPKIWESLSSFIGENGDCRDLSQYRSRVIEEADNLEILDCIKITDSEIGTDDEATFEESSQELNESASDEYEMSEGIEPSEFLNSPTVRLQAQHEMLSYSTSEDSKEQFLSLSISEPFETNVIKQPQPIAQNTEKSNEAMQKESVKLTKNNYVIADEEPGFKQKLSLSFTETQEKLPLTKSFELSESKEQFFRPPIIINLGEKPSVEVENIPAKQETPKLSIHKEFIYENKEEKKELEESNAESFDRVETPKPKNVLSSFISFSKEEVIPKLSLNETNQVFSKEEFIPKLHLVEPNQVFSKEEVVPKLSLDDSNQVFSKEEKKQNLEITKVHKIIQKEPKEEKRKTKMELTKNLRIIQQEPKTEEKPSMQHIFDVSSMDAMKRDAFIEKLIEQNMVMQEKINELSKTISVDYKRQLDEYTRKIRHLKKAQERHLIEIGQLRERNKTQSKQISALKNSKTKSSISKSTVEPDARSMQLIERMFNTLEDHNKYLVGEITKLKPQNSETREDLSIISAINTLIKQNTKLHREIIKCSETKDAEEDSKRNYYSYTTESSYADASAEYSSSSASYKSKSRSHVSRSKPSTHSRRKISTKEIASGWYSQSTETEIHLYSEEVEELKSPKKRKKPAKVQKEKDFNVFGITPHAKHWTPDQYKKTDFSTHPSYSIE